MKNNTKTLLNMALLIVVTGAVSWYVFSRQGKSVPEGELAPDFETELIDGTAFQLSALRGNYVILDFWGSWCRPCRLENPKLAALYNKYHDAEFVDATGMEVVTVALEKQNGAWERAAEADGFSWKYQIVEKTMFVTLSDIATKYGVTEIPAKFLIDPQGRLRSEASITTIDRYLESQLK